MIAHEFTHSGIAWALGYTSTPFTVEWGNPLTMMGWDEGVPYDRLFPAPGNPAEAAIGGGPLALHFALLAISLAVLTRRAAAAHRGRFLACYVVAAMNLAELVAYLFMRPFIPTGDTGRFNHGLGLSPWPLFLLGSGLVAAALWTLLRRIGPTLDRVTDGSRTEHRAATWAAGFVIFLWSSGIRMLRLYPDPQWRTGLIGVAGLLVWIALDPLPARRRTG